MKGYNYGCRTLLNPNGSSLRCGDKVNHLNWEPNEGAVQLCEVCKLHKRNATLESMLNRKLKP